MILVPSLAEGVADVNTEKSAAGAPEHGSKRKSALAPQEGNIATEDGTDEKKEVDKFSGHNFG